MLAQFGPAERAGLAAAAGLVGFAKSAIGGAGSVVHRLDQSLFERLVVLFTMVSSLNLLR